MVDDDIYELRYSYSFITSFESRWRSADKPIGT